MPTSGHLWLLVSGDMGHGCDLCLSDPEKLPGGEGWGGRGGASCVN
jgi:hypothetical protein